MTSWNQSKTPSTRSTLNPFKGKNFHVDDACLDKHRIINTGRMMNSPSVRLAHASINNQKEIAAVYTETEEFEYETIFSKEKVNALLSAKFKGRMYDSKAKQEWMTEYMKKLKVCIKWFQKGLEDIAKEKDNLRKMLDLTERKNVEAEAALKSKEEELNATISELETSVSSLKASLTTEVSEKLREKEVRMALEKNQDSLREELKRSEQNALNANKKVKTQADMYKRLQEYITSLQQYNAKLQAELTAATDVKKQVEKEKVVILENLSTLRVNHNMLHKKLNSAKISGDS